MKNRMLSIISLAIISHYSNAQTTSNTLEKENVMVVNAQTIPDNDTVHIGSEDLKILHGISNSDIFLSTPGLQVNNARNEAGALDIGIRGIQDEGRVNIIIDNSLQSALTDRGYQGKSDRTYIDMDLIREIDITKGSSIDKFSGGAIGGIIRMRTIDALDIIPTGENFGFYLKSSIYNNNRIPSVPDNSDGRIDYAISRSIKPGHFNNGAYTTALALKNDVINGVVAFSSRKNGNYFAGSHHYDQQSEVVVPKRGEVPNTSFESESGLIKLNIHPDNNTTLDLNFRRHVQEAGEVRSAYWHSSYQDMEDKIITIPQWQKGTARINTFSANYSYNPIDINWLDLSIGLWSSHAKMKQTNGMSNLLGQINDDQYLEGYRSNKKGFDIANSSYITSLDSSLTYGLTYQRDRSTPNNNRIIGGESFYKLVASARHGVRTYTTGYLNLNYDNDLFNFLVGSRVQYAKIKDLAYSMNYSYNSKPDFFSQVTLKISPYANIYGKFNNTYRLPNMYESTRSMMSAGRDGGKLSPENGQYYTFGVSGGVKNIINNTDRFNYNVSYFNNKIKNFISTDYNYNSEKKWYDPVFNFKNYSEYRTKGFELTLDYDSKYFFGKLSGTLYDDINVCDTRTHTEWDDKQHKYTNTYKNQCSSNGFGFSTLSARIPSKKHAAIVMGAKLLNDNIRLGAVVKYHSAKKNPPGISFGAANNILEVSFGRTIDLFSQYRISKSSTFF
ncbi:TonB-dependent receptor domain-containing protein [Pseudomonas cerasi]